MLFQKVIFSLNDDLSGKASSSHTHDDRYYTESEINTLLAGKAASNHTHSYAAATHGHAYTEITGRPTFSLSGTTLTITF